MALDSFKDINDLRKQCLITIQAKKQELLSTCDKDELLNLNKSNLIKKLFYLNTSFNLTWELVEFITSTLNQSRNKDHQEIAQLFINNYDIKQIINIICSHDNFTSDCIIGSFLSDSDFSWWQQMYYLNRYVLINNDLNQKQTKTLWHLDKLIQKAYNQQIHQAEKFEKEVDEKINRGKK